jgi:uncharacterized protein (DUF3820 family)
MKTSVQIKNGVSKKKKNKQYSKFSTLNHNKTNPIRYSDETWNFGKYKRVKLVNIPKEYLEWALKTMNLSDTSKCTIEELIKNTDAV